MLRTRIDPAHPSAIPPALFLLNPGGGSSYTDVALTRDDGVDVDARLAMVCKIQAC